MTRDYKPIIDDLFRMRPRLEVERAGRRRWQAVITTDQYRITLTGRRSEAAAEKAGWAAYGGECERWFRKADDILAYLNDQEPRP